MRRTAVRGLVSVGLLAWMLGSVTGTARAAGEVVVSASPSDVEVGQPVEVLVRTFRVVGRTDLSLPFETPVEPYPVPSGVWNVLYSWPDYPFDVVAQHEDGAEVAVTLLRDPSDSTLWRGVASLPKAGRWTIWVRNFPNKEAGSTTVVNAHAGPPASTEPAPRSTASSPSSIEAGPAALIGALLGLLGGFVIARTLGRRLPS